MRGDKYDDADFHYGSGEFEEKDLPDLNGGTHIGFFLAWLLLNRMESDTLREYAGAAIEQVRARQMTGREFLFEHTDQKLMAPDINEQGNAFARSYYNRYLVDYEKLWTPKGVGRYEVEDTWANYDLTAAMIQKQFLEMQRHADKPWWKFWG